MHQFNRSTKIPYIERKVEKLNYAIGEVAVMFDVNTSLIRFWEKEFGIIKPKKNKKGNRLFTKADIDNFKRIFILVKEKGYTLEGAKKELKGLQLAARETAESIIKVGKVLTIAAATFLAYKVGIIATTIAKSAFSLVTKGATIAQNLQTIATKAATLSMKAFNAVLKLNPLGLLLGSLSSRSPVRIVSYT